ncbi:MAG: histidine--tRNA ligase [Armatimonadota bacterium]
MQYSAPRGTADILPSDSPRWRFLENRFRETCRLFGYEELRTPTFEETELFTRSIGEHTDIVGKEMYTFTDKGGRSITLRPEGTAPVVRAYLQHKLYGETPVNKVYYIGSIFRYERPQAGRFREHHQVGIEAIGSKDPAIDAEVISLAMQYLTSLGISNLMLKINSVGCPNCRPAYRETLRQAVAPYVSELCESCRNRYDANPLRMLDCKVPHCGELTASIPSIIDHLCEECSIHHNKTLMYLDVLQVPYKLDHRLVRGFDYYTKTAFEIVSESLGAQNAVLGGGRYDGLVEEMGGPPTPAIGFGSGIERQLGILEAQGIEIAVENRLEVYVATLGETTRTAGIKLLAELRGAGISANADYSSKSLKAQMKVAGREQASLVVIIGEDELNQGIVKIRNMDTKEESIANLIDAVSAVEEIIGAR